MTVFCITIFKTFLTQMWARTFCCCFIIYFFNYVDFSPWFCSSNLNSSLTNKKHPGRKKMRSHFHKQNKVAKKLKNCNWLQQTKNYKNFLRVGNLPNILHQRRLNISNWSLSFTLTRYLNRIKNQWTEINVFSIKNQICILN